MAEINAKISKGNKGVTIEVYANTYFGHISASVDGAFLNSDENVYECAQKTIDFVKQNIEEKKENPYYG